MDTPDIHTIEALAEFLDVPRHSCLKTLVVEAEDEGLLALVLRGDHELNAIKAERLEAVRKPLTLASAERIASGVGCEPGSLGPVGLEIPVIADQEAAVMADFACGANVEGRHYLGVNWGRDASEPQVADLRNAVNGDPAPDGSGTLSIARGIEVGHMFQLGTVYSEPMKAVILDDQGHGVSPFMGCYGIGVTRVIAAAIEQNHDDKGIIWPTAIAPFQVALLPMNMHKSRRLRDAVEELYTALGEAGIEVLLDDRSIRPGVMFADADLVGTPHRLVLGERGLDAGTVEYKHRVDDEATKTAIDDVVSLLTDRIREELG